jgi:hypothetical protein
MIRKIFKYEVLGNGYPILIPEGGHVLSAQIQDDKIMIWVLVNPTNPLVSRYFEYYGTGEEIYTNTMQFIGTVLMKGGSLVWHVFEKIVTL